MKPVMLIVDDDEDFRALLCQAMRQRGIECLDAPGAEEGMALVDQVRFTHAILDLNLGGGESGLVVLRYLVAAQPECEAIILTGYASIATAVEATKCGAVQYLPKPATTEEILAAFEQRAPWSDPEPESTPPSPKRLEWEYIQRVLLRNRGNVSATARELGMHRRTLQRKLAKRPPRR